MWVDHLRRGDAGLAEALERGMVSTHPFVVGELACGNLRDRATILELLNDLPAVTTADLGEVLGFIERHGVHGKGIGYVDAHLLAAVALTDATRLWTRDKRLHVVAHRLGLGHEGTGSH